MLCGKGDHVPAPLNQVLQNGPALDMQFGELDHGTYVRGAMGNEPYMTL